MNRPQTREANLITDKFGLKKDSYILFLGRLVPEKGIRYLVEAFKNVKTDKKLVIAGGSSDTDSFMKELKELAKGDDRILFTGFVQGAMLDELYGNAYIYARLSDFDDVLRDGNMSKEEFIRQRDAYRVQEDERMAQIQRLRTEKNQAFQPVKKDTDNLQAVMNTVGEAGDVMHLSQNVVETFIDRIEVFNDERVKIHFTFENVLAGYAE